MSDRFLRDNAADRALGKKWEEHFCRLAAWYGKSWHAYQHDRTSASGWQKGARFSLTPDIQIFTAGGEYHEVKHKNATKNGIVRRYGWETYRLTALGRFQRETQQPVFYTIHDWELAGFKRSDVWMPNLLQDWRVVDIATLESYSTANLKPEELGTWLSGRPHAVPGYFWPTSLWTRLDLHWGLPQ